MNFNMGYQLLWLFFIYSFGGWIAESIYAALRQRRFVNRGILNGPLCCIYGFAAVAITLGLQDLQESLVFLFLGAAILGGFVEWLSGRLLEKVFHRRWWDYSAQKYTLDGYVSLRSTLLWGVAGILGFQFLNPLLLAGFHLLPIQLVKILLWVLLALTVLDTTSVCCALLGLEKQEKRMQEISSRLQGGSYRLNNWIVQRVTHRTKKAHPTTATKIPKKEAAGVFAAGCGFYKLVWLFVIGAFLGDITETLFCRVTAGVWMSRSSVVWGPFSIVWGLAIALATLILYNYRNRSDGFIFLFGTLLGGAYEYLCSVFTELVFGKIFWDYSSIPFNLGGRINLLYCFFWGIAAVLWLKKLYPIFARWIERIPMRPGKILTWVLVVFMVCNLSVSSLALARSAAREMGIPARNQLEELIDEHYGDEVIERIYPGAKSTQ